MKEKIVPAILENNFSKIDEKLESLLGQTNFVQIDVCDGVFTPNPTWPYITAPDVNKALNYDGHFQAMLADEAEMSYWEDFEFELDLMIKDHKRLVSDLLSIGPKSIVLHFESFENAGDEIFALKKIIPSMIEIGIALRPSTDVSLIYPLIDEKLVTFVQCMGIQNVGMQGQSFDERVYKNISTLRNKYPDLIITVDGGVSKANADKLLSAGANRLVVGSKISEFGFVIK